MESTFKSYSKLPVIIDNKQKQWVLISLHTVQCIMPMIYDIHVHTTIQIMLMINLNIIQTDDT